MLFLYHLSLEMIVFTMNIQKEQIAGPKQQQKKNDHATRKFPGHFAWDSVLGLILLLD
jgi:hypothetical protein